MFFLCIFFVGLLYDLFVFFLFLVLGEVVDVFVLLGLKVWCVFLNIFVVDVWVVEGLVKFCIGLLNGLVGGGG